VKTICRCGTGAQIARAIVSAARNVRFWWQLGQKHRFLAGDGDEHYLAAVGAADRSEPEVQVAAAEELTDYVANDVPPRTVSFGVTLLIRPLELGEVSLDGPIKGGFSRAPTAVRGSQAPGRDLAAHLVHRRTTATLREVAAFFGPSHPDSASNLIRRADKALAQSTTLRANLEEIERPLLNTR
jgi:hypothetical protein